MKDEVVVFRHTVESDGETLFSYISQRTGVSGSQVKRALTCGACQLQKRGRGKRVRVRKAKYTLGKGDRIFFSFDPAVVERLAPSPVLIEDNGIYSVWDKPPGLLSQGTAFGDHCSMARQVALFYKNKRAVFLVHRLDREASGVMLFAHTKKAAATLSAMFQNGLIEKRYRVLVQGNLAEELGESGTFSTPLDGKKAITHFQVERYDAANNATTLLVRIDTGRRHQIRRHLNGVGFPVLGDPRYGHQYTTGKSLKLRAVGLSFLCPLRKKKVFFSLSAEHQKKT